MTTDAYIKRLNAALERHLKGGKGWRLPLPLPSSTAEWDALNQWLEVLCHETGTEIQIDLVPENEACETKPAK